MAQQPERQTGGAEVKTGAIEAAAAERAAEVLKQNAEKVGERLNESEAKRTVERARVEAANEAISGKEFSTEHKQGNTDGEPAAVAPVQSREESYTQTMKQVQQELSPAERTFSKVIHNPTVERVSDITAATIARPNAILSGSISAFLLVLGVYLLAKQLGFSLNGFETIAAFIIGWLIGMLFDLLRTVVSKKR